MPKNFLISVHIMNTTLKQVTNYTIHFLAIVLLVLPFFRIFKSPNLIRQLPHSDNCLKFLYIYHYVYIKKHRCSRKNQVFILVSSFLRSSFQNGNKEFLTPPRALNKLASLLNPEPSLAPSQILKYTKDDL